jgi:protein-S-isoprenylcysteine O-methyltransferase Ste14
MSIILAAAVTIVSLAALLQHGWAYRGHFVSETMPPGALLLTLVVVAMASAELWALWTGPQWPPAMLAGLVLQLASLWLFWRAIAASRAARLRLAFDPALPGGVVRDGPYRVVRHPFYTSYMLFWIGWSIATWSIWSLPPLLVILAIYVFAARGEEGRFARSPFADEYAAYRQRVGMFWPRLSSK